VGNDSGEYVALRTRCLTSPLAWEYWLPESRPLPDVSPKNAKYQAAIGVWKRLPVGLTKWLGPSIVRGIP
jgi:hypothetical protein